MLKVRPFASITELSQAWTYANELAFSIISTVYTRSTKNKVCINLCLIPGIGRVVANIGH